MIQYMIEGGRPLQGTVTISGAKNAAVAILPATLLVNGTCRIENVPDISDVRHQRREERSRFCLKFWTAWARKFAA